MNFKGRPISRRDFLKRATLAGSAAVLTACAPSISSLITPEVEPTATKEELSTNTPEAVKNYDPIEAAPVKNTIAINPTEYSGGMGGNIESMTVDTQEFEKAKAWLQLYKMETGRDGQEVREWVDQADFVSRMNEFAASHPNYVVKQVEAVDKSSVMTVLVKSDGSAVVWGFGGNGALAFTEPNIYMPNNLYGEITLPENTRPEFAYNPEDNHWYLYAVGEDDKARAFFCATGATRDNLTDQWIEYDENGKLTKEYKNGKWERIIDKPTIVFQMGRLIRQTNENGIVISEGLKNDEEMKKIPAAGGLIKWPDNIPMMSDGSPAVGVLAIDRNYAMFKSEAAYVMGGILVGYQRFSSENLKGMTLFVVDFPIVDRSEEVDLNKNENFPKKWLRRCVLFHLQDDDSCGMDTIQNNAFSFEQISQAVDMESQTIDLDQVSEALQPSRCDYWNGRLDTLDQPGWFGEVWRTRLNGDVDVSEAIESIRRGVVPNDLTTPSSTIESLCALVFE